MLTEFWDKSGLRGMFRAGLPYPPGGDRAAWERVPMREQALEGARQAARKPYPLLTASDFMAFVRSGDRQAYEKPYFERRHHLIRTVVGECAQWRGAFLDDAVNGLWLLAEETSWAVSAHNVDSHPGSAKREERPLPDKRNPVIDLFAAQTGATVSLCCHLLVGKLDGITPLIRRRMRDEVERRILRPFFQRDDFWWMGMIRGDVNNWTPWILSNILICLLYWEQDSIRLSEGIRRAMEMLDRYLAVIPEDGGCDEGAGYWNMAGASLLDCLELIRHATDGLADFYQEPKIRAIAAFPVYAHIQGPYFWNFADCDAKPLLDGERLRSFGIRTGNERLSALGAELMAGRRDPWPMDTPQMSRTLDFLFSNGAQAAGGERGGTPGGGAPETLILSDLQVWACRKGPYYAAVKAGHNGENHNHNDVGSFLLYIRGEPAVIDAGNAVYTAQTFSSERYALWHTRSRNHNVAIVAGFEQRAGAESRSTGVTMDKSSVNMELRCCYSEESGLLSYVRRAELRGDGFWLHDRISLKRPAKAEWVFLLREEPKLQPGLCAAGTLRLRFPGALRYAAEAYPVTDARMKRSYPGTIWRLSLAADAGLVHEAEFGMEECV